MSRDRRDRKRAKQGQKNKRVASVVPATAAVAATTAVMVAERDAPPPAIVDPKPLAAVVSADDRLPAAHRPPSDELGHEPHRSSSETPASNVLLSDDQSDQFSALELDFFRRADDLYRPPEPRDESDEN